MLRNPKYLYGDRSPKIPIGLNFAEYILGKLELYHDRTAFLNAFTNQGITYGEIARQAKTIALMLRKMGIERGDMVAMCSENLLEYWGIVIGVMACGATYTPLNLMYTSNELNHVLNLAKPKLIFISDIAKMKHGGSFKHYKTLPVVQNLPNLVIDGFIPVPVVGQSDTVALLYSSGTTGLPKAVQITHYNALVCCTWYIPNDDPIDQEVSLSIAPWYHAFGLWGKFISILHGRVSVFIPKFEEKLFLDAIQKYKPRDVAVVPPIMVMLSKTPLLEKNDVSSVVTISCGAAPLDIETINEVMKRFPNLKAVLQGYGMTEMTLTVTRDLEDSPKGTKSGSVGTVVPGVVIKVVDLQTEEPLGPYQKGEIRILSECAMKGYLRQDTSKEFDKEGFYKSGDIGYYDDDGYFYIVDRIKELIKYKGNQVAPAELEAELLKHPSIRDAGVVGAPDRLAGEVPLAFVVRKPGCELTEAEVQGYIAERLSGPKHLRGGVRFVDLIPRNPSGKILRKELRKMIRKSKL